MLWYILYPVRGTTSAPDFSPDHPIRHMLSRYGVCVAHNVTTTLLISVALATALIYPIPFLYTSDFASGASGLPHHVWTNAQPVKDAIATIEPDVVMRSIWVHGPYMKALDRDVLLGALDLQDAILGPTKNFDPRRPENNITLTGPLADLSAAERDTFHVVNGLTNQSWFFHSPLLYWKGDRGMIEADPDVLATVNEHKNQHTSVNVTLRHSVVFSGKRFEDRVLVAADALVITLIHLRDSPVGRQWERKVADLRAHVADKWDVYPRGAHSLSSQLYEFQFLPISWKDSVMLAVAYSVTVLYLVQNLLTLPAVKSRAGLVVTVVAQIVVSIMSSFTVCAIFKIDLSRIPLAAYPIVMVSMSLENMLRLIKSVMATSPEESTSSRIGAAFGKTTHIALVSVLEHLLLLWGISKLVTSSLSDFCAFLAIAILFDFFYLATFFLSVLSIEVRRSELSDFIEKSLSTRHDQPSCTQFSMSSPASSSHPGTSRQSWAAAILQGRVDASTRIAGTMILLGFVIIAQWHFFENESMLRTLSRLFTRGVGNNGSGNSQMAWGSASAQLQALHQARSPTAWLRLQDHETAQEVIHVVNPSAHGYIARVYEPLVLVLKGSDRIPPATELPFPPAVYDFVRHQTKPLVVTILVLTAAVRIFMNYLLWDEMGGQDSDRDMPNEPLLSVKTMNQGHELDVALLAASADGVVVTVGLDRRICVFNVRSGGTGYRLTKRDALSVVSFPVLALAINDDATWLAILSSFRVMLWNLASREWGPSIAVDLSGQKPGAFFFTANHKTSLPPSLIVVRRNGTLVKLWPDTGESFDSPICKSPLLCAVPLRQRQPSTASNGGELAIVTASQDGCIHRALPVGDAWMSEEIKEQAENEEHAHAVVALAQFSAYLVVRAHSVDLVDLQTSETLHTFEAQSPIRPGSLRYLCAARKPAQRGPPELSYFSLVYTSTETGSCVMQTVLPKDEGGSILFGLDDRPAGAFAGGGASCLWHETRQVVQEVPDPGLWEALPNGSVVGVRQAVAVARDYSSDARGTGGNTNRLRRRSPNVRASTAPSLAAGRAATGSATSRSRARMAPPQPFSTSGRDIWEVWAVGSVADAAGCEDRNYVTRPLAVDEGELLVADPGPMVCVGAGAVALGLGTTVKIITMGHAHFGSPAEMLEAAGQARGPGGMGKRRRKHRSHLKRAAT